MATLVEQLLILQERDRKLTKLAREAEDIPKRKKDIDSRLNAQRASLKQANDDLMAKTAALKNVENEIESIRDTIRKYREQQFQIKNNDEYKTLEKEIATAEEKISQLEDKQLMAMDAIDEVKQRVQTIEEGMKVDESRIAEDFTMLDKRAEMIEKELSEKKVEREGLLGDIPADMLRRYERIMKHLQSAAMVPIQNGACGGCHMKLPPQIVNDAKKQDQLTLCSYCGRIVYRND